MPLCPNIVDGPGRCAEHRRGAASGASGYGAKWAKLRARFIAQHPVCELCGSPRPLDAHHVDHARPGDPTFYRWDNLQALCRSCHRKLTEAEKKRARLTG